MEGRPLARIYIVDDDPTATALLSRLLSDYSVSIVGTADDLSQARDDILELQPDLLFLDVEMPAMSGLDFWTAIVPDVKPQMRVVFYTGYDRYLLEALRRRAFDYMLKPATRPELAKIMTRYYEQRLMDMQPDVGHPGTPAPLMIVNAAGEHATLRFDDVAFFRFDGERRLWQVVTTQGQCTTLRHRTTADVILDYSPCFVQIHKRYIVNVKQVAKVLDTQLLLNEPLAHIDELRISKNFKRDLMNAFYNL